jgi:DNA polymerase-3 subunit alpha
MSFVHLHVHSTYSLLDGFSDIKKLVATAKNMGMNSLALTDHGTMFGSYEFYLAARAAGIKPVIGLEAYLSARGMRDKDAKLDRQSNHMLLLAENETGYQNLLKIASAAQVEGFFFHPRIDRDFLARHSAGLIATSGCMASDIPRAIVAGDMQVVQSKLDWYYEVFGPENYFLELQEHNIADLPRINKALLELGPRYNARYVATNDVHYIKQEDSRLQDVLLAVQTGARLGDSNRFRMGDDSYYLRSPEEMARIFAEVPEALSNTQLIADRTSLDLQRKSYHIPQFDVPEGFTTETYLRHLSEEGFARRYGARARDARVRERLDYELGVIHTMGFDAYFLIVWDLCRFARSEGIWYNARGSAAGSLVAYVLDITLVEPIDHGLIFERFLNPGRNEMPDIDLDFQDDLRVKVMEYCSTKYGADRVAQIITFGTMGARAALKDVGRVMDIPLAEVDRVSKLITAPPNKPVTLVNVLAESPELRQLYNDVDYIHELVDTASQMEGTVRNAGTHAAGVIISDRPIVEYAPLHRPTSGAADDSPIKSVVQYEMSHVDKLGLLKVDFLGLATLTIMQRACKLIQERHGIEFNLNNIPTDDPETYEFLSKGRTAGVFQLEGDGMTKWIVEMKPRSLANVIAMVALYRPGPMADIPKYIRRMHGEEIVEYRHPLLAEIMKETYGVAVYQEQVMFAAIEMAGYTASEADYLRKAISKKDADAIAKHAKMFVEGCVKNGIDAEVAESIFEDWKAFASYAFNKSHAADYGVIAVQTGYLKAHYTAEYMTALLSASKDEMAKVAYYAMDCRNMGIEVLPPDINTSGWDFTIEDRPDGKAAIRFGLGAVKNVGEGPVTAIIAARAAGPYADLTDLANRLDLRNVGKRPLEALTKVGALDCFGPRLAVLQSLDRVINVSTSHFRAAENGQLTFFGGDSGVAETIVLPYSREPDRKELLSWEKELIGMYISAHPLTPYEGLLKERISHQIGQLKDLPQGMLVAVGGIVLRMRPHATKDGKPMGYIVIEDLQGELEMVLFPKVWEKFSRQVKEEMVVVVEGKVDNTSANPKLLMDKLTIIQQADADQVKTGSSQAAAKGAAPKLLVNSQEADWTSSDPGKDLGPDDSWTPSIEDDWDPGDQAGFYPSAAAPADDAPVVKLDPATVPGFKYEVEPIVNPRVQVEGSQVITLVIRASDDLQRDMRRLKNIQGLLLAHPGTDHFQVEVIDGDKVTVMDFPNSSTRVSPELLQALEEKLGTGNVRVHPVILQ